MLEPSKEIYNMLDKNIKYALYGVNRVSKDFIYIFGESINVTIFLTMHHKQRLLWEERSILLRNQRI